MPATSESFEFIDEYERRFDVSREQAYGVIGSVIRDSPGPLLRRYARLVGVHPAAPHGTGELAVGDAVVGFRVVRVEAPKAIVLEGRHHFARYRLTFALGSRGSGASYLRARTDAAFPGRLGPLYRAFVIGTRGHALVVWLFLRRLERAMPTS
ncbi:MAG: hypothetical protein ACRCYQ_15490 [Nocardioides sp.]